MKPVLYLGCPPGRVLETGRTLASIGYEACWVDDAAQVLLVLEREECPVLVDLVSDAHLEIAREVRLRRPWTALIALADPEHPETTASAVRLGVADVISRLLPARHLTSLLAAATRRRSPQATVRGPVGLGRLFAASPAMQRVVDAVRQASLRADGVLVCGEPGSGRRCVARAIHEEATPDRTLVVIDCGRVAGDALEIALFGAADPGSRRGNGAPRGAVERITSASRLHQALGGTLLLVEAGQMGPRVQARLARVLSARAVAVDGSAGVVEAHLRVIATAGVSLDRPGAAPVRRDLSRALAATRIDVPSLRERREDIPALIDYFLTEICAVARVPRRSVAQSAVTLLASLPYGDNARELRDLLETLVQLAPGRVIKLADVLANVRIEVSPRNRLAGGSLRKARARFERDYIAAVLNLHGGRMTETAAALGIQRTNLYRKLRALGVNTGSTRRAKVSGRSADI